ncbi:hypothetical protein Cgig2_006673 [Carnegiea gigantea]|uniref:Uncharacterized protein n=1 Tax=Carnegiea gigantea TaxID=171969 RepID=A0A9Q1GQK6_9CARY|nr:hypothetical protein Cgig2_006673 [Carnegiea gigantea]
MGIKEVEIPLRYLGVPITASRLTKLECRPLIEKKTAKINLWSTRNISFAGRAVLMNTVIFGMFNYWASIFILPSEVLEKITQISRNYMWSGTADFKRAPHISWQTVCKPKKYGGLGITDFYAWNKATIVKLIWVVVTKKDILWVKWIHGCYLKNKNWWDYKPPPTHRRYGTKSGNGGDYP